MEKRTLGRTGLEVSILGFGAMAIRNDGQGRRTEPVHEGEIDLLLNTVLDSGVNFIDTAPDYGNSERYIGDFVSSRREEFFLATKCGCAPSPDQPWRHVWTRNQLMTNIEASLKALKTDYVDVLQLHNPGEMSTAQNANVNLNELVEVLEEIRANGWARYIGISDEPPYLPDALGTGSFDTVQMAYGLYLPRHKEMLERVEAAGAGAIIRGAITQGFSNSITQNEQRRDELDDITASTGLTRGEMIVRYAFSDKMVDTVIIGTANLEHFHANLGYAEKGVLPEDIIDRLEESRDAAAA